MSNKSSALLRQAQHRLFLGTSFERRICSIPPYKGGGTKVELVELFVTGDFFVHQYLTPNT